MWEETLQFHTIRDYAVTENNVFFLSGVHDYNTPLALVSQYYDLLEVKDIKELILFEESSHNPFFAEPQEFHQTLCGIKGKTYEKS
jgi:pimeloyl-ACP methyl ester carboxylesterase